MQASLDAPIIQLDTIDSTNNYAMRLIDADTAQPGMTIVTRSQEKGKGQHGKHWFDEPDSCLLMSIVIQPNCSLEHQFAFNAAVATAVADVLTDIYEHWKVNIKWPNDIIVDDKKAGGILIENVVRGTTWAYSIVGVGINVLQKEMPDDLPYATSLHMCSKKTIKLPELIKQLRDKIIRQAAGLIPVNYTMDEYNGYLYRRDQQQQFNDGGQVISGIIKGVSDNGLLALMLTEKNIRFLRHGEATWVWSSSSSKEKVNE